MNKVFAALHSLAVLFSRDSLDLRSFTQIFRASEHMIIPILFFFRYPRVFRCTYKH